MNPDNDPVDINSILVSLFSNIFSKKYFDIGAIGTAFGGAIGLYFRVFLVFDAFELGII